MAENETGVPPKKETGKVQPKKETVRINLPPRPAAAPTIKMPTVPPAGTVGATTATPPKQPVASPSPGAAGAQPATAGFSAPVAVKTTEVTQAAAKIEKLDFALAIGSAVVGLLVVASVILILIQSS